MIEMQFNCPEPIAGMKQGDNKFHCKTCDKKIIDYSGMNNRDILASLKDAATNRCGIFRKRQLTNPQSSKLQALFRMAFCAVFFFGFSTAQLSAQDTSMVEVDTSVPLEESRSVTGRITEEANGEGVPFSTVLLRMGRHVFTGMSDLEGFYKIKVPVTVFLDNTLQIEVYSVGFGYIAYNDPKFLETNGNLSFDFALKEYEGMLVGIVCFTEENLLDKDPYSFGKTVIKGDDLRRMP